MCLLHNSRSNVLIALQMSWDVWAIQCINTTLTPNFIDVLGIYRKTPFKCPIFIVHSFQMPMIFPYRKNFHSHAPIFLKSGASDFKNILYAHLITFTTIFMFKAGHYRTKNLYMPQRTYFQQYFAKQSYKSILCVKR